MPYALIFFLALTYSISALAYVGPGLGAGTLAAIVGVIASLFLALFAVIWYPFKRFLKKRKKNKQKPEQAASKQTASKKPDNADDLQNPASETCEPATQAAAHQKKQSKP